MYQLPEQRGNDFYPMMTDYGGLTSEGKQLNRKALLVGWWENDNPAVIANFEVFIAALQFYVQFYVKRCHALRRYYYRKSDWSDKWNMVRMLKKRRALVVAPRECSKTFTLIFELAPFIAQFRPQTELLIGGENWLMVTEKIENCRKRIENNELIRQDFGHIYPQSRAKGLRWNNSCLDFLNGSRIHGSSVDGATRGRHPQVGIIDDPEGKKSKNSPTWRKQYMTWLKHDYMPQFDDKHAIMLWVGTLLHKQSCLYQAMHDDDGEGVFRNWAKKTFKMIMTDPVTGEKVSAWPEKMTVDEFEQKKRCVDGNSDVTVVGFAAAMAEFQGEPMADGDRMFIREERRHGYMIYEAGGKLWKYNPETEQSIDYEEWLASLYCYAGVDLADSTDPSADYSAVVVLGIDSEGVIFVLDAWHGRVWSEKTTAKMFMLCHRWCVLNVAIEIGALAGRIVREAIRMRKDYEVKGLHLAKIIPQSHGSIPKEMRIERMQPDWQRYNIKLPIVREMDKLTPHIPGSRRSILELIDEFDTMTGEGTGGADDLLDACEKAHLCITRRPKRKSGEHPDIGMLRQFKEELGIEFRTSMLLPQSWSPETIKRMEDPTEEAEAVYADAYE